MTIPMIMFYNLFFSEFSMIFSTLSIVFLYLLIQPLGKMFDSISKMLILLTLFLGMATMLTIKTYSINYNKFNKMSFIMLTVIIILSLTFFVDNFMLFYFLFELSVIPIYFNLMTWGTTKERQSAGLYLFFYTFSSSIIFLIAAIYLWQLSNSFHFCVLWSSENELNSIMSMMMVLVFIVKLPVIFVHVWLPRAHVESPLGGSMILAGIMLKLGGYGIVLLLMTLYWSFVPFMLSFVVLGLLGSVLAAMFCLNQVDLKRTVAFASVSHMSMMFSGLFTFSNLGLWTSVAMMLVHGICSSGMFYGLGVLYYRIHSRSLLILNSTGYSSPVFSMWWFFICIMNMAFPPTLSFVSELSFFCTFLSMDLFNILAVMFIVMGSSIYTIMLLTLISSGSEKELKLMEPMNLCEHMIFLFHSLGLLLLIFMCWAW